tara:strand:- start:161 stop:652 length:492 start_codon:yes stop_codon:yes gene_type:complete
MPTLYELSADLMYILDLSDKEGGDESLEKAMEDIQGSIEEKAEAIGMLVAEMNALADARKAEAQRLMNRSKVAANAAKRAKEYLRENMAMCGMQSLETKSFKISRCRNSKGSVVVDDHLVPDEYKSETVQTKIDTDRIREELESGAVLPFATLKERGENLRIK